MSRRYLAGLLLIVSTGMALALLVHHRCRVDEERALADLVRFGEENRAFAYDINGRGYVSPARLVKPSDDQPSVRLLPSRFLLEERRGYRFEFEGADSEPSPRRPWLVSPAFRSFEYRAASLRSWCSRRSFLLSSETMAVHGRDDGLPATIQDPIVRRIGADPTVVPR